MTVVPPGPEPGRPAPDFTLLANNREEVTLSAFRGRKVLLAFYVLDFTGG